LKDNHHTWGIVGRDLDKNKFIILVDDTLLDSDHLRNIYRMTIAEEFAHVLLHREAIEKVENIEDFKVLHNHGSWYKYERNAKWLAAAILIPREHILSDTRALYKKMVCVAGFGNPKAIKKKLAGVMADRYEVSVSTMTYRISNWPIDVWKKVDTAMKDHLEFLE
jgi:Zn-dependent peptidase ImmA (M78 family)